MINMDKNIECAAVLFERARKVYGWLEDEVSRNLFVARLEYNVTNSQESINKMLEFVVPYMKDMMNIRESRDITKIKCQSGETIILYGAGQAAKRILNEYKSVFVDKKLVFCDKNYAELEVVEGIPVISPEELFLRYRDSKVIITSSTFWKEIYEILLQYIAPQNIYREASYWIEDPNQYFVNEITAMSENEIFVDAGVFDGQTSITFAKQCNGEYEKIYLFEPDLKQMDIIKDKIKQLQRTEIFFKGLWNEKDELMFKTECGGGSKISAQNEEIKVEVDSLDNVLGGKRVTFIKMDIEGAELKALQGARKTIAKHKPKLAICIYHKPEDILEIPYYLKSIVPEYKLYIRHHSSDFRETVLYAVVD